MSLKSFVKLLIPPIFYIVKSKINRQKFQDSPLPQIQHHSNKMIIIGNGPSLNQSVEKYKDKIMENDRIAVNYFASSELYEVLKPNIYCFADPAFFYIPENQKQSIENLFEALVSKTNWTLRIFVPLSARDTDSIKRLLSNPNIVVDFYYDGETNLERMNKFEAWDKNLVAPPARNVLNVALYLSLFWNYKETYLIGADSSFLEDLRVDQDTNELFTIDTHFYNNKSVYSDKKLFDSKRGRVRSEWKLHDLIYSHGRMFEYYYDLKEYADYKGLKVYNASEYSWINVFERKKLS